MSERDVDVYLANIVRKRILRNKDQIENSLRQTAIGNPLGAEPLRERRVLRISKKANLPRRDAAAISSVIELTAATGAAPFGGGAEAVQGPTIDFTGVEFLSRGRWAANAVGRIVWKGGRAQGTGFLVAPGILITNNHVIQTPASARQMLVEFDYELDDIGSDRPTTVFEFAPERFFLADPIERHDFTVLAVGMQVGGAKSIADFGYIPLSDAADKHMLGELANIIQHPLGAPKQVVVRENSLVARDETVQVLHYIADTDKGSSGAPVCNNDWEPIALHHWGGPALEVKDINGNPLRRDINEGIRVSAIVSNLKQRRSALGGADRAVLEDMLSLWDGAPRRGPSQPREQAPLGESTQEEPNPRTEPDGSVTWTFPIEINVRSPLMDGRLGAGLLSQVKRKDTTGLKSSEERNPKIRDFSDRGGYEPGFIPGFMVPLPNMTDLPYALAVNTEAPAGDNPHELRYHHFSIFVNSDRRLAAVTACNIDGGRIVAVNRETKTGKSNPTLKDLGVEAFGAEASDDFQPDPRIAITDQMANPFYRDQNVPGHPKPEFPGNDAPAAVLKAYHRAMMERTARMFQKGHIIMRGDPAWGLEAEAIAAEADTFFYTNAAPQLGFFNQGSPVNQPGSKGTLRWRALESYVLRNAFITRQRICVFAGPIFDDGYDVEYRSGALVPMRFWKIAVWADGAELKSIALLADQKPVLELLTEGTPEAMERFDDEAELSRVAEFLTTVADVQARTGLRFSEAVHLADVRRGEEGLVPAADFGGFVEKSQSQPAATERVSRSRKTKRPIV